MNLPGGLPDYRLNLIWHPLYENEPDQAWFRKKLYALSSQELNLNIKYPVYTCIAFGTYLTII